MNKLVHIINKIVDKIEINKDYLTDLDREIGDGDHGVNLSRGGKKLEENISSFENLKEYEVLNKIAMLLLSNVGGASGALYSTALMRGASYLKNCDTINEKTIGETFSAMIKGIEERGKSTVGEKTMLDTLVPASEAFNTAAEKGCNLEECFQQTYTAGKKGMEYTKNIKATKGRASYLGDRSIGTLDPGAVSSYLILETIKEEI